MYLPQQAQEASAAWTSLPWTQVVYGATVGVAVVWLAADGYARWRRKAANETDVSTAGASERKPDFLKVDTAARKAAQERGDDYERHLREREAEARRAAAEQAMRASDGARRFTGSLSLFMSVFTLVSMIAGAVGHIAWIGSTLEEYSATDRLKSVVVAHPIAFAVAVLVITYHVYQFIVQRKWQPAA